MIEVVEASSNWLIAVGGAVGVIALLVRKIVPKVRHLLAQLDQVHGALLGRPPVVHPDTGEVLAEATPAMGQRFALIEEAILKLSESHEEIRHIREQMEKQNAALWAAIEELRADRSPQPNV